MLRTLARAWRRRPGSAAPRFSTAAPRPRVRFAPSPTGYLHIGGLRTALFNHLFARATGGTFVLRIEDTDQNRLVPGSADNLRAMLEWAGVRIDEGPTPETPSSTPSSATTSQGSSDDVGAVGPYTQSERLPIYRRHVDDLIAGGHAYPCFCSPERLTSLRKAQKRRGGGAAIYDRRCHVLPRDEVERRLAAGEPHVVRMLVPQAPPEEALDGVAKSSAVTVVEDTVVGRTTFAHENIDDQVLLKSDGFPTYHLANVVDDHLMGITHVIRGEEWLPSTPKHLMLYSAFGWTPPVFAHLPLLLNPGDRSKLSKRQGDVAVEDYARKGFLPAALCNFVALLGWNPGAGDTQEFFTPEELASRFRLEDVNKGGAVVDQDRLSWLSSQHLRRMAEEDLVGLAREARPFLTARLERRGWKVVGTEEGEGGKVNAVSSSEATIDSDDVVRVSEERLKAVLFLLRDRVRTLTDFAELSESFFVDPETDVDVVGEEDEDVTTLVAARVKMWDKRPPGLLEAALVGLREEFGDGTGAFPASEVKRVLKGILKEFGESGGCGSGGNAGKKVKMKDIFLPLRFAVSGRGGGADLMETMELLGGEVCLRRLERLLVRRG